MQAYAAVTTTAEEKDAFLRDVCAQERVSDALRRVVAWRIGEDSASHDGWDRAGPEDGAGSFLLQVTSWMDWMIGSALSMANARYAY